MPLGVLGVLDAQPFVKVLGMRGALGGTNQTTGHQTQQKPFKPEKRPDPTALHPHTGLKTVKD